MKPLQIVPWMVIALLLCGCHLKQLTQPQAPAPKAVAVEPPIPIERVPGTDRYVIVEVPIASEPKPKPVTRTVKVIEQVVIDHPAPVVTPRCPAYKPPAPLPTPPAPVVAPASDLDAAHKNAILSQYVQGLAVYLKKEQELQKNAYDNYRKICPDPKPVPASASSAPATPSSSP
jgi:hypothetical protein